MTQLCRFFLNTIIFCLVIDIVDGFNLVPTRVIGGKYEVVERLGSGWESEVYLVREIDSDILRAAKLFYADRNKNYQVSKRYAQKMHRLSHCDLTIHYSASERMRIRGETVVALISEYIHGQSLASYLKERPGRRLQSFEAVHLLYVLAKGMAEIHQLGEYHGDLHSENIMVKRVGLNYEVKLIDMFVWNDSVKGNIQEDIINLIHVFYETLGGKKHYARQPPAIKYICCGLKRGLIASKFRNARDLCLHIETFSWDA